MRVLALDQATHLGFSVFNDGKLVSYGLGDFSKYKDITERINQIKMQVSELIDLYKPDIIGMEDCQMQFSPQVFKTLAMLQGVLRDLCFELEIKYEVIPPPTWRASCGIKGRKREEQKANALIFVRRMFNIEGDIDDISDAICIGYHLTKSKKLTILFYH
jgi:Holliday junction resolvasome RuvABC endonuclease subunit